MRCVESGVQSGLYLAPMSRAFSLSSALKGFWKPLRTNTTPSSIFLNGTCCTLAFCGLGLGSGLDWLSRFFSADLCCAGEAAETIYKSQGSFPGDELICVLTFRRRYLWRCWGSACWPGSACVWGSRLWPRVRRPGWFSLGVEQQTVALCWTQIFFLLVAMRKQLM